MEEEEGERWNESHLLPSFSLPRILGFLAHLKMPVFAKVGDNTPPLPIGALETIVEAN